MSDPPPEAALPLDLDDVTCGTAPLPELPGFEVLEEIGRGGMGIVYRARQTQLGRMVAVKLLLPGVLADEAARRRFQVEARAVAGLGHEGIVAVHHADEHQGQPYLVMEHVAGGDLARAISGGPLDPRHAADLVRGIADALQFAHEKGVLHRDLKPSNVLLGEDGRPRLTDFGLAKRLDSDPGITLAGQTLGSPGYISPEQAGAHRGEVGPASDVYSLGAVLYCLLTGRPPFLASTLADTLHEVLHEGPVGLRALNPSVPAALEVLCLKCLEKRPADRYESAAELAADLGRFLGDEPIRARPPSRLTRGWRWSRRHPTTTVLGMLAVMVALGAAGTGLWLAGRAAADVRAAVAARQVAEANQSAREEELRRSRSELYASQITAAHLAWKQGDPRTAWERLISVRAANPGWEYHYLQRLFTQGHRTVMGHSGIVTAVAFSPNGRWLASCGTSGTLQLWDVRAGRPWRTFTEGMMRFNRVAFAVDGRLVLACDSNGWVKSWECETGDPGPVLRIGASAVRDVVPLSDGRRVAVVSASEGTQIWDLLTGSWVAGFEVPERKVMSVAVDRSGRNIAAGGQDGTITVRDLIHGNLVWRIRGHVGAVSRVAYSPAEDRLLSAGADGQLRLWSGADGREIFSQAISTLPLRDAVFSPDGQWTAATGVDLAIRLWKTGQKSPEAVLRGHTAVPLGLAFDPGGRLLASAGRDGTVRLWDLAQAMESAVIKVHEGPVRVLASSPDARWYLSSGEDGKLVLGSTLDLKRRQVLAVQGGEVTALAFAPDGRRAVVGTATGATELWELDPVRRTQAWTDHSGAVRSVTWSADGLRVATAGDDAVVRVRGVSEGAEAFSFPGHAEKLRSLIFCQDGRQLASVGTDRVVRRWDTVTRRELPERRNRQAGLLHLLDTPQGLLMVSQGADRHVWIERLDGQGGVTRLGGENPPRLRSARLTADGRRLLGAGDRTLFIWDVQTRLLLLTLAEQPAVIRELAISADQSRLIMGDAQGRITVLDATPVANDAEIRPPQPVATEEGAEADATLDAP